METHQHADHDRRHDPRRDLLPLLADELDEVRERFALHVVHHQEELLLQGDDIEHRRHVRMADARSQASFVQVRGEAPKSRQQPELASTEWV
jgi:hypothetical protein